MRFDGNKIRLHASIMSKSKRKFVNVFDLKGTKRNARQSSTRSRLLGHYCRLPVHGGGGYTLMRGTVIDLKNQQV